MQLVKKTIIVTGCNKGIGLALVEALAAEDKWSLIMACRNTELTHKARQKLINKVPSADIEVAQLDISDEKSINNFCGWVKSKEKKVDVLVNNAAILVREWNQKTLDQMFATNFFGTVDLTEKLLPVISQNGKILAVSSSRAKYKDTIVSSDLIERWSREDITKEVLFGLVDEYKESVKAGTTEKQGYLVNKERFYFYPTTKLALSTYIKILSKSPLVVDGGIQVYNVHPGYINTDMSQHRGTGTVEEGIDTLMYLIHLPFKVHSELQGKLLEDRKVIELGDDAPQE